MPQLMYTPQEMSSFGEYLLSEERAARIESNWNEGDSISLEERKRQVYGADWDNWLHTHDQGTQDQAGKANE